MGVGGEGDGLLCLERDGGEDGIRGKDERAWGLAPVIDGGCVDHWEDGVG